MKYKHVYILFIAFFLYPYHSNAENLNENLNSIVTDIEQQIVASENSKPAFIVVRAFIDKSSMQPNELSQKAEINLLKIILDRYLGQRKTIILNWQSKTPLVAIASSETGVVQYRQGLMGKNICEQFGDGFLISGTTGIDTDIVRIDVELIDMGTGNVLARSTESIKLKAVDLKLAGPLPPPPAQRPLENLNKKTPKVRLYIEIVPQNANVKFLNITDTFYQGIELKAGKYQIEISAKGYAQKTEWIALEVSKNKTSTIRLEPLNETKDLQYQVKSGKDFRFEGYMKDGMMHGQGTYFYKSGDKYQGQWEKNKMHGQGAYVFVDGEKYVGQWENGKMSGQGTYFYKNGDKFVGEWKNRKKSGPGTYYFSNGDSWEGNFLDNKKHGPAEYIWANGQSKKEYWENGKLIQ